MEKITVRKADIVRIRYKPDVTIYYTLTKLYVCTIDSEVDWNDSLLLTLATNERGDK